MILTCCKFSRLVGVMTIAVEVSASPERVKEFLKKKGLKPADYKGFQGTTRYDCRLVQEAFNNVKM